MKGYVCYKCGSQEPTHKCTGEQASGSCPAPCSASVSDIPQRAKDSIVRLSKIIIALQMRGDPIADDIYAEACILSGELLELSKPRPNK